MIPCTAPSHVKQAATRRAAWRARDNGKIVRLQIFSHIIVATLACGVDAAGEADMFHINRRSKHKEIGHFLINIVNKEGFSMVLLGNILQTGVSS